MLNFKTHLLSALYIVLFFSFGGAKDESNYSKVKIGVVLDLESPLGTMADLCMSMAVSDFYSVHSHFQTRISLHPKHADNILDAASAVLGLLKNEEVHAIVGPQSSTEATFAAQVGQKAHVPVISFATGFPGKNPYFIRTSLQDSYQAKALASLCEGFKWHEIVVLYEDTDSGHQFISHLIEPFYEAKISLYYTSPISSSSDDYILSKELEKLMTVKSRVFLVHMNILLGTRFFLLAKKMGLMSTGYAWIITDSLSNVLNSMNSTVIDSMEGVLGIRPYVPQSKNLEQFKLRWKKNKMIPEIDTMELNVYGFWAYDTIWALAIAVENSAHVSPSFSRSKQTRNGTDITNLRVSKLGPEILEEILRTKFEGLSGTFEIINGQLQGSTFEIINVIGPGDRTIGYWTSDRGIARELEYNGKPIYSTSTEKLKLILWPGDTFTRPIGWAPKRGKLKVGVPKKDGFFEFVNVQNDTSNKTHVTGFSIDIFLAAKELLPFHLDCEFVPFMNETGQSNGSYSDMLHKIGDGMFDIVVGDTAILDERAVYVDFALPYTESGLVMVVKNKKKINMWIFIEPLRWDLWVAIAVACIVIGVTLRILEHRSEAEPIRLPGEQLGLHFWFPIAALAFPERNMVANNWSRFVLVMWLFMAFILMQSYTAKLSAIFTVDQLQYSVHEDFNIGHQEGSFVKDLLTYKLHFNESRLKQYSTMEEYHDAMTIGSKKGGIDAIFDETPYMKLFLRRYGNRYRIINQTTYKTDGFSFAFPLDSPLVSYFSRAILTVTQGPNMTRIEETNFGPAYMSGYTDSLITQDSPSLTAYNFGGLFIIVGSATLFALFCSMTKLGQYICEKVTDYTNICFSFLPFNRMTRVHSIVRENQKEDDPSDPDEATEDHSADIAAPSNDVEETDQGQEIVHSNEVNHESGDNARVAGEVQLTSL